MAAAEVKLKAVPHLKQSLKVLLCDHDSISQFFAVPTISSDYDEIGPNQLMIACIMYELNVKYHIYRCRVSPG